MTDTKNPSYKYDGFNIHISPSEEENEKTEESLKNIAEKYPEYVEYNYRKADAISAYDPKTNELKTIVPSLTQGESYCIDISWAIGSPDNGFIVYGTVFSPDNPLRGVTGFAHLDSDGKSLFLLTIQVLHLILFMKPDSIVTDSFI